MRVAAHLLLLLLSGCTIIIEPPDPPPIAPFFVPFTCLPVAVDLVTGEPELEEEPAASAQIIFTVRIDRTTANLASTYDAFMTEVVAGVAALGVQVSEAALVALDERPVPSLLAGWGCGLDDPEMLTPEQVLRFYATTWAPPPEPIGCATDPLVDVGARLVEVMTNYPDGLAGTSGRTVFGEAPGLLLIVHLDALARRTAFNEAGCQRARALATAQDGTAAWLEFFGPKIAMNRVVHWFVATDEGVDDATLAARCRAVEGFDLGLFDGLEASPRALYDPLASEIQAAGGRASRLSMCRLTVEKDRQQFLLEELGKLAADLGVSIDARLLLALLGSGGNPREVLGP